MLIVIKEYTNYNLFKSYLDIYNIFSKVYLKVIKTISLKYSLY